MARLVLLAGVLTSLAAPVGLPSAARATEPVRAGTIVGGLITTGGSHECGLLPDCLAWLTSDCDPALAGQDPAWLASIVDVEDLADDGVQPRVFEYQSIFATAFLQFWTEDCTEIRGARTDPNWGSNWNHKTLRIRGDAKWMTVSGNGGLRMKWTLT